jgi:energy-coupling factor transport system ATP-binding protein
LKEVNYTYPGDVPVHAVKNVSLDIEAGACVALCGHNGSGKSTLARLMNGLLEADGGEVYVNGLSAGNKSDLYEIRKTLGIVFQNPDNQTVAAIIEDDVAFGPENIGVPSADIRVRVDDALRSVGMSEYAEKTAARLSGGQKQRVAIAGILALKPRVIVLDESTAMLDPKGRREVLDTVLRLNREEGITVVLITHFMEEAVLADKIYVMNEGEIALSGGKELFYERADELRAMGLTVPPVAELTDALRSAGVPIGADVYDEESLVGEIIKAAGKRGLRFSARHAEEKAETFGNEENAAEENSANSLSPENPEGAAIAARNLSYSYSPGTAFRTDALTDVRFTVRKGDFVGIIGHTGSGKSTLAQHLNGLIKMQLPSKKQLRRGAVGGTLTVGGIALHEKYDYKELRSRVGMVFQYPEYQLFDETVLKDVGFGPRNLKLPPDEVHERAKAAIEAVGLDFERVKDMSPFELSGGQKRRAAIAGVIAMRPEILVLDEPTAGLDPRGRREIMDLILKIKEDTAHTVVMVSHDMDEIARRCNKVLVLNKGRLEYFLPPAELYRHADRLIETGLDIPLVTRLCRALRAAGADIPDNLYLADEFVRTVAAAVADGGAEEGDAS